VWLGVIALKLSIQILNREPEEEKILFQALAFYLADLIFTKLYVDPTHQVSPIAQGVATNVIDPSAARVVCGVSHTCEVMSCVVRSMIHEFMTLTLYSAKEFKCILVGHEPSHVQGKTAFQIVPVKQRDILLPLPERMIIIHPEEDTTALRGQVLSMCRKGEIQREKRKYRGCSHPVDYSASA
jgi:hypothetical protein